jgi:hypothetical protein
VEKPDQGAKTLTVTARLIVRASSHHSGRE